MSMEGGDEGLSLTSISALCPRGSLGFLTKMEAVLAQGKGSSRAGEEGGRPAESQVAWAPTHSIRQAFAPGPGYSV